MVEAVIIIIIIYSNFSDSYCKRGVVYESQNFRNLHNSPWFCLPRVALNLSSVRAAIHPCTYRSYVEVDFFYNFVNMPCSWIQPWSCEREALNLETLNPERLTLIPKPTSPKPPYTKKAPNPIPCAKKPYTLKPKPSALYQKAYTPKA